MIPTVHESAIAMEEEDASHKILEHQYAGIQTCAWDVLHPNFGKMAHWGWYLSSMTETRHNNSLLTEVIVSMIHDQGILLRDHCSIKEKIRCLVRCITAAFFVRTASWVLNDRLKIDKLRCCADCNALAPIMIDSIARMLPPNFRKMKRMMKVANHLYVWQLRCLVLRTNKHVENE